VYASKRMSRFDLGKSTVRVPLAGACRAPVEQLARGQGHVGLGQPLGRHHHRDGGGGLSRWGGGEVRLTRLLDESPWLQFTIIHNIYPHTGEHDGR
jgi:hypothetical protein